jgi:hypothetical protein
MLLRQIELQRVLGRKLLERLVRSGLVEPIRSNGSEIVFDSHKLHLMLSRIQRGLVRNDFRPETRKVQEQSFDQILANFSINDLQDE